MPATRSERLNAAWLTGGCTHDAWLTLTNLDQGAMRGPARGVGRGEKDREGCRSPSVRGKGWVLAMLPAKRRLRVAAVPRPGCARPRPCPGRPAAAPGGGLR